MHALTGWVPERISINTDDPIFNKDAIFDRLKDGQAGGRCLITVATGDITDSDAERTGLVSTHAYAVLNLREVDVSHLLYFIFYLYHISLQMFHLLLLFHYFPYHMLKQLKTLI